MMHSLYTARTQAAGAAVTGNKFPEPLPAVPRMTGNGRCPGALICSSFFFFMQEEAPDAGGAGDHPEIRGRGAGMEKGPELVRPPAMVLDGFTASGG